MVADTLVLWVGIAVLMFGFGVFIYTFAVRKFPIRVVKIDAPENFIDQYQKWQHTTESGSVRAWDHDQRLLYFALGLAGEAGEVAEKIKKLVRDDGGKVNDWTTLQLIKKELGDVCWYHAAICNEVSKASPGDLTVLGCYHGNFEKLTSRLEKGTINGSGDNR
jgi:NTP pyrophosphatase (non-canonical NTP hydrolase)